MVGTAVDGQGDHGPTTSANHYRRSSDLCYGASAAELNDFINIHHAFLQTELINPNWPYNVLQALPFQCGCQEETATYALVPHYYGFHKLTSEEVSKMLHSVPCTSDPLIQNPKIPKNPRTCYLLRFIYFCHYLKLPPVADPNTFLCLMYLN